MAAAAMPLAQVRQEHLLCSQITALTGSALVNAGVGALAGYLFSVISPAGGAVFGATATVSTYAMDLFLTKLGCEDDLAAKITKFAVTLLASLAIAGAVTSAFIATPISFTAAATIWLAMNVVGIGIGCLTVVCCVPFIAMAEGVRSQRLAS